MMSSSFSSAVFSSLARLSSNTLACCFTLSISRSRDELVDERVPEGAILLSSSASEHKYEMFSLIEVDTYKLLLYVFISALLITLNSRTSELHSNPA
uniref:Uncharacterized protein n=1 Tax=Ixodes ricinus TaxID=34613 RepID=A0A6B0UDP6_IXORI